MFKVHKSSGHEENIEFILLLLHEDGIIRDTNISIEGCNISNVAILGIYMQL